MLRPFSALCAAIFVSSTALAHAQALPTLAQIEARTGGRLGVVAVNTQSGKALRHRADERFMMLSTFKVLLCAHVLHRVDIGQETLGRVVSYGPSDLLAYAPITAKHVGDKGMSVEALCAAALQYSDNTAANVLLGTQGGPAGLTAYLRTLGDSTTHLDRTETALNEAVANADLDSTTPEAFLRTLRAVALGQALRDTSRAQLVTWLLGNTTGDHRLRAGVPTGYRVADKMGTAGMSLNDVGIFYPPRGAPVMVAVFVSGCTLVAEKCENALADVARRVVADLSAAAAK